MKRTAAEAFGSNPAAPPIASSPAAFQPSGAALVDPKAYFLQWQQAGAMQATYPSAMSVPSAPSQGAAAPAGPAAAAPPATPGEVLLEQLGKLSAVKCAALVKEKLQNLTTLAQIEALHTMASKSSFKLREELVKQPHVRKLAEKVKELARRPPPGFALPLLVKAAWSLTRFPDDVRGDAPQLLGPAAKALAATSPDSWDTESAAKILWCLGRTDAIYPYKDLVSKVVAELIKDKGRRVAKMSHEGLVNLLFAVARARQHKHKGDHPTVHLQSNDEVLFDLVHKKVREDIDTINVQHLGDLIHTHADVGLRKEGFFKLVAPRIIKDQSSFREDVMAKIIKAYARFMIPLKEEAQGFRTMAVVAKGDFMRPSDKPKRTGGKKTFDKPQALFPKTQVHSR